MGGGGRWAGRVFYARGYGLIGDIAFVFVVSIVGSLVFRALGVSPGAGPIALVVVASIGAVLLLGAQRMLWHATA